jgi:hypothetical protein
VSDTLIQVVVRDGRAGRDESAVTEEGGEILFDYVTDVPPEVGQVLTLENGTEVEIIGYRETITLDAWRFVVFVGDIWDSRDVLEQPPA